MVGKVGIVVTEGAGKGKMDKGREGRGEEGVNGDREVLEKFLHLVMRQWQGVMSMTCLCRWLYFGRWRRRREEQCSKRSQNAMLSGAEHVFRFGFFRV